MQKRGAERISQGPDLFPGYIGRFAPSPTGPLHLGSLVAAFGSWLDARANDGVWLVRIEDLDPPREQAGSADIILRTLDKLGLYWDGPIVYQSQHLDRFELALHALAQQKMLYPCNCSRKVISRRASLPGLEPGIYPGTCLGKSIDRTQPHCLRVKTTGAHVEYSDRIHGIRKENLKRNCGDFIVKRRDGLHAYQLAVVVDDFLQKITHVVRGADLLDNTGRQVFLQSALDYPNPSYMHLPVVLNAAGEKLSKQTGAQPLLESGLPAALFFALRFMGQNPPGELARESKKEILEWALSHWQPNHIGPTGAN